MKKIFVIFTFTTFILFFIGVPCMAETTVSPGIFWNCLVELDNEYGVEISELIKSSYIKGIAKGIMLTMTMIDLNESDHEIVLFNYNFINSHIIEISKVMDDLYKDPANTLIKLDWMCRIAYSKLRGEDVESLIRVGRALGEILPDNF